MIKIYHIQTMTLSLNYPRLILLLFSLFAMSAFSSSHLSTNTRWQIFYLAALKLEPTQNFAAHTLNQYSLALLRSDSQYPDFKNYTWQDITELSYLAEYCQSPNTIAPHMKKAIQFELALCHETYLDHHWFKSSMWQHPAGGSYADRYIERLPKHERQAFSEIQKAQLTLASPYHPLHLLWQQLGSTGIDALLGGYRLYLTSNNELWLSSETGWHLLPNSQWRDLATQLQLTLEPSSIYQRCDERYSNICFNQRYRSEIISYSVLLIVLLSILGIALRSLWLRYQEGRERRFILQLLTHELRTPIASLGFTVESLRNQFDELMPQTQDSLWRLIEDHQRLAQLCETSRHYLSPSQDTMAKTPALLSDFFAHCIQGFDVEVDLQQDQILTLPYYWLGLCVINLLNNAQQHGAPPIRMTISIASQTLRIEVKDNGKFPYSYQRLWKTRTKNRLSNHNNMGVGIKLVKRLMRQMDGKLIIRRHPTRCILELPLS